MEKQKIVLLDSIDKAAFEMFEEGKNYKVEKIPTDAFIDTLPKEHCDAVALGVRSGNTVSKELLVSAPELLAVGVFGIGTNRIDIRACSEKGVAVFNAPYCSTESVAELVLGGIFYLARNLGEHNTNMHRGDWLKSSCGAHEIRGKTLGIIGYGNIGEQLAVNAKALDMQVCFYDKYDKPPFGARKCFSLESLLRISDFVSIHINGDKQVIGKQEIELMKDGAYVINVSRGGVVDEQALRDALDNGKLAGVALDVFKDEDPNNPKKPQDTIKSPLQGHPKALLTPHVAGSTKEAQAEIGRGVAEKIRILLETGSTQESVNVDLPKTSMQKHLKGKRTIYFHKNIDGAYARFINAFGDAGINIKSASPMETEGKYGYVMADVNENPSLITKEFLQKLEDLPEAIRVRVIER